MYRAFSKTLDATSEIVFDIDRGAKRMRSKVTYADQRILVVGREGIVAGMAINANLQSALQLEMLGFRVDKTKSDFREVLVLFSLMNPSDSVLFLKGLLTDQIRQIPTEIGGGITRLYGTCGDNLIRGYRLMGFRVCDTRAFGKHTEYLIEMDIALAKEKFGVLGSDPAS